MLHASICISHLRCVCGTDYKQLVSRRTYTSIFLYNDFASNFSSYFKRMFFLIVNILCQSMRQKYKIVFWSEYEFISK